MDSRIYILTHKRLTGQLSFMENSELARLSLIPENKAISEEISYLWNISNNYFPSKDWKKDDAKKDFLTKIRSTPAAPVTVAPVATAVGSTASAFNWKLIGGLAAAIAAVALIWFLSSTGESKEVIKATNTIHYAEVIDDTKVWLDKGATLTILEESASVRKVALEGEAIFDVSHDPTRPFTIDLGDNIYAEVLGTSFRATSGHDGSVASISVTEGKVRLYSSDNAEYDLILLAGEEGELSPSKDIAFTNKSAERKGLMNGTEKIVFSDTPIKEALDRIGIHFGVEFEYHGDAALTCHYTSTIMPDYTLEETLQVISQVHPNITLTPANRSTVNVDGGCTD